MSQALELKEHQCHVDDVQEKAEELKLEVRWLPWVVFR